MQSADLPSWAEQRAAELLGDLGHRWAHVQGVAAQARRASAALLPEDRPYLIAAAWLHDIGYAPPLKILGFHPIDGARYVRQRGCERLASLVAYHSEARFEAQERGFVDALAEFPPADGPLLDALTYADMTTGPAGHRVTCSSPALRSDRTEASSAHSSRPWMPAPTTGHCPALVTPTTFPVRNSRVGSRPQSTQTASA